MKKRRVILKPKNVMALALRTDTFRIRVVRSQKQYTRKVKHK